MGSVWGDECSAKGIYKKRNPPERLGKWMAFDEYIRRRAKKINGLFINRMFLREKLFKKPR